jgi:hypothetical protein
MVVSKVMQTINFSNVSIDIHDGPIGFSMSGGADSTILGYILMKYAPGPIHIFTCANRTTNARDPFGALTALDKIMERCPRNDITYHAHWVDDKKINNIFNSDLVSKLGLKIVYNGFTRPPPAGAIVDYDTDGPIAIGGVDPGITFPYYWDQSKSEMIENIFGERASNLKFDFTMYTPFLNINKKGIAQLYKELEFEELYSSTRSCESLTLTSGHCGKCWWCKERIWAFGKLD